MSLPVPSHLLSFMLLTHQLPIFMLTLNHLLNLIFKHLFTRCQLRQVIVFFAYQTLSKVSRFHCAVLMCSETYWMPRRTIQLLHWSPFPSPHNLFVAHVCISLKLATSPAFANRSTSKPEMLWLAPSASSMNSPRPTVKLKDPKPFTARTVLPCTITCLPMRSASNELATLFHLLHCDVAKSLKNS